MKHLILVTKIKESLQENSKKYYHLNMPMDLYKLISIVGCQELLSEKQLFRKIHDNAKATFKNEARVILVRFLQNKKMLWFVKMKALAFRVCPLKLGQISFPVI